MIVLGQPDATLSFDLVSRTNYETQFHVTYKDRSFEGMLLVSDYHNGSPVALFEGIARDWRGWDGTREWADLEEYLTLSATSDSTGHVTIDVKMNRGSPTGILHGQITLEAGQLDETVGKMRSFFARSEGK